MKRKPVSDEGYAPGHKTEWYRVRCKSFVSMEMKDFFLLPKTAYITARTSDDTEKTRRLATAGKGVMV